MAPGPRELSRYTPAERRLIATLRTPRQVQRYLRKLPYNWEKTLRTFRGAVEHRRAHCLEAVLFAAAILEHHGYPPTVLDIESVDGLDHVLFLYRHDGRWGTVARSRDYGLHGRPPVYRTPQALVRSYMDPFVDGSGRVNAYGTANLDVLVRADWRLSRRNVWSVERALIEMPHTPLLMPDARYERMLARYMPFKASGKAQSRREMRRLYGDQVERWW
ncbi:MAG: hypothetical protein ABIZ91_07260 [Gemmatimonadaceae bacterium]